MGNLENTEKDILGMRMDNAKNLILVSFKTLDDLQSPEYNDS